MGLLLYQGVDRIWLFSGLYVILLCSSFLLSRELKEIVLKGNKNRFRQFFGGTVYYLSFSAVFVLPFLLFYSDGRP